MWRTLHIWVKVYCGTTSLHINQIVHTLQISPMSLFSRRSDSPGMSPEVFLQKSSFPFFLPPCNDMFSARTSIRLASLDMASLAKFFRLCEGKRRPLSSRVRLAVISSHNWCLFDTGGSTILKYTPRGPTLQEEKYCKQWK